MIELAAAIFTNTSRDNLGPLHTASLITLAGMYGIGSAPGKTHHTLVNTCLKHHVSNNYYALEHNKTHR